MDIIIIIAFHIHLLITKQKFNIVSKESWIIFLDNLYNKHLPWEFFLLCLLGVDFFKIFFGVDFWKGNESTMKTSIPIKTFPFSESPNTGIDLRQTHC